MLSYLRLKSHSWVVKLILAIMAVGLAFFFGYGTFRQSDDPNESAIAIVNGDDISQSHYANAVKAQMNLYSQMYGGEIPEFMEKMVRDNVLDQLVEQRLLSQWAAKNGVPVAKQEIAEDIFKNEQFKKDGVFNTEFYKGRFRPWFKSQYGLDYEDALADDLRVSRATDLISKSIGATASAAPNIDTDLAAKTYHFKQVAISAALLADVQKKKEVPPAKDKKEDKTEAAKTAETTQPAPTEKDAEALANIVLKSFPDDKKAQAVLSPYGIEIKDLGKKSLKEWRQIAPASSDRDSNESFTIMQRLLALSSAQPIPSEPFKVGDTFYVYKLVAVDTTPPTEAPDPKQSTARFTTLLQAFLMESLRSKAQIEMKEML